jgi:hypothetical protein
MRRYRFAQHRKRAARALRINKPSVELLVCSEARDDAFRLRGLPLLGARAASWTP